MELNDRAWGKNDRHPHSALDECLRDDLNSPRCYRRDQHSLRAALVQLQLPIVQANGSALPSNCSRALMTFPRSPFALMDVNHIAAVDVVLLNVSSDMHPKAVNTYILRSGIRRDPCGIVEEL